MNSKGSPYPSALRRFAQSLLVWNRDSNRRAMPWKGEKDPYRIWLSEVILQQTRVEQGLKYYENFTSAYPDVKALAAASDEEVFRLWEGLGYYSRCRNLLATARFIAGERDGIFPDTYEGLLALKGVGPYTAAAIASFAYDLPHAVLDGNVFRVLARVFGIDLPINSREGRERFAALAQEALPKDRPAEYNQAIMDFGATICRPAPRCADCFFTAHCTAFQEGSQLLLPVKEKKSGKRQRWLNYIVLVQGDAVAVRQRTERDIWQDLHEFLLLETGGAVSERQLLSLLEEEWGIGVSEVLASVPEVKQQLSHQTVFIRFLLVSANGLPAPGTYRWVNRRELSLLAFPKTLREFAEAHLS
jgi:A/G-specific adenine glycosylase